MGFVVADADDIAFAAVIDDLVDITEAAAQQLGCDI